MAKLKDGFYKQTAEAIGSDLHVLLAGGGSKALSDFATSTGVVTALGTNGNYVTWTKNGTANNLVVPYAAVAEGISGIYSAGLPTSFSTGRVTHHYNILVGTEGLFPNADNANSILTVNRHAGNYLSQLGFSSNKRLYFRSASGADINSVAWNQIAYVSEIPTKVSQLTNDSGYVIGGPYLPLAGGNMANTATIKFTANGGIIQTTATTHNAASVISWYKGTSKDANYNYSAQIGWYNMGDTDGAMYLVPNPQNAEPWGGTVGLFIGKNTLKWNNQGIIHSGNIGDQSVSYANSAGRASTVTIGTSAADAYRAIVVTNGSNGLYTAGAGSGKPQYNYSTGDVKAYSFTTDGGNFNGNVTGTAGSTAVWASSAVSTNLDTVENRHGWANSSGSATNLPTSVSAGTLVSFSNSSSKLQFFGGYKTTHGLHYRKWYSSSWESWRTILDSDNWTSFISIPSVGNGTVTINQGGVNKGSFTLNQSAEATINLNDTNYYPTAFSWTGGTAAGPTGSLTGVGMSSVSFGAIPAASSTASGIVTTGNQSFSGQKTFNTFVLANYITPISDTTGCGIGTSAWRYYEGYFKNLYTNYIYMYPRTYSGTLYLTGLKDAPSTTSTVDSQLYASSYVKVQNSASSSAAVYAPGGFYESSDERLKNLLKPVRVNLDELSKLRKVYYTWKNSSDLGTHLGVIAQDVQRLYPELVTIDSETGYLSLSYDKLSVIALEAIDTLYKSYKELKRRVDTLEKLITNKGIL